MGVQAEAEGVIVTNGAQASPGQAQRIGHRLVGERKGAGARHGTGHIGDTIMYHAVDHISRVAVGGGAGCLNTTSLVHRHINNDRAIAHLFEHIARDQPRRTATGNQNRTDDQIRLKDDFLNIILIARPRLQRAGIDVI